jgi:hypothetical protein
MASEKEITEAHYYLGNLYVSKGNNDRGKIYYIKAIKNGCYKSLYEFNKITSSLERYKYFSVNSINPFEILLSDVSIVSNEISKIKSIKDKQKPHESCCPQPKSVKTPLKCPCHVVCSNCYVHSYFQECSFCNFL